MSLSDTIPPLTHTSYWTIMPADTNYMFPLVFGGAMMSQVDLTAATHVRLLLNWSVCDKAVTFEAHFKFLQPAYSGNTIKFVSKVVELRNNSIRLKVLAYKSEHPNDYCLDAIFWELIGTHELIFVSKEGDLFRPHRLSDKVEIESEL